MHHMYYSLAIEGQGISKYMLVVKLIEEYFKTSQLNF